MVNPVYKTSGSQGAGTQLQNRFPLHEPTRNLYAILLVYLQDYTPTQVPSPHCNQRPSFLRLGGERQVK